MRASSYRSWVDGARSKHEDTRLPPSRIKERTGGASVAANAQLSQDTDRGTGWVQVSKSMLRD